MVGGEINRSNIVRGAPKACVMLKGVEKKFSFSLSVTCRGHLLGCERGYYKFNTMQQCNGKK
jgi:hypothetical protein